MYAIKPIHYRKLTKVFERSGFTLDRQEGDHLIYIKSGTLRPIVIPKYKSVPVFIRPLKKPLQLEFSNFVRKVKFDETLI